jgi:hypothetical protein
MPLTRAQVEDFVQAFFRDHRLPAPPIGTRKYFKVTLRKRKRLNLPRAITRQALADQVAAWLCREVSRRDKSFHWDVQAANTRADRQKKRPKWFRVRWEDFVEWRKYVRGIVVHHFGKGDGLE